MIPWDELPDRLRTEAVRPYYEKLKKKQSKLLIKRMLDVFISVFLLIILLPVMVGIGVWIARGSKGGVFYYQDRVTTYGRKFTMIKFRTMIEGADENGAQLTLNEDERITEEGRFLRKYRLDELPQLINVIAGEMTLVGTRPEVRKYVDSYTDEMWATLLLPAGVTSEASIRYKDESRILEGVTDDEADEIYVDKIIPEKMKHNLAYIDKFSIFTDIKLMLLTVIRVIFADDE